MFTTRTRRTTLAGILVLVLAASAWAEDSAAPAAKDASEAAAPAGGCPNSETGACCATCQEKAAQAKAAEDGAHDCPCKRARAKAAQQGS